MVILLLKLVFKVMIIFYSKNSIFDKKILFFKIKNKDMNKKKKFD